MKLNRFRIFSVIASFFILVLPTLGHAQVCENLPALNLNAVSSEDIDNDMVRLIWTVQLEKETSTEAMVAVNKAIEISIKSLVKNKEIINLKNNIQTFPQYNKDRSIRAWQAQGTLSFEMRVESLKNQGSLALEKPMALSNLEYFASDKLRAESRTRLTQAAILEFQNKAKVVVAGFGQSGYTLGEININDENQSFPQPMYSARMMTPQADSMMAKGIEVATAAGSSRSSVSINGRVCLQP